MTCKEIFLEEMGRLFHVMWEYFDEDGLGVLEVFDEVQKKLIKTKWLATLLLRLKKTSRTEFVLPRRSFSLY